ncbi:acyl-CoA synthetase short-chain family member 3, mitochondrial-like isoform X2 [Watersipora subatra]
MADVLRRRGVEKGDRVIIYMPMIPEALVSMLACARIGAIHCLVFGGFSAKELSVRVGHCKPKVLVTASYGIEPNRNVAYVPIVEQALSLLSVGGLEPDVIIYNRPQLDKVELKSHQYCYGDEMSKAIPVDCVPLDSQDPLYILYTSGTTGQPKGVVRSHGGHAVALNWTMGALYGLKPGEVWWSASDLGWIVGHSYICYSPLLHGNTTIIYEGKPVGTPDSGSFFRVLSEHNVASMFTAPTALRAIRKVDPDVEIGKKYPLPNFRTMFVAGEHCDVETAHWTKESFRVPVLDNWWQTETGWAITCHNIGLGNTITPPDGTTGLPVPGYNVKVLRPDLTETADGELGNITVKLPLPPGFANTLYLNDTKYEEYFTKYQGYYDTADSGFRDKEGYISVMARTDDIINVAGHRLSTSALEEAIMAEEAVAECAVVGIKDKLKGQVPLGLCVMKQAVSDKQSMTQHIIAHVREHVGPVAAFKLVVFVPGLPKTRSGKIARATLAALADGRPYKVPPTIEDETVYTSIEKELKEIGLAERAQTGSQ